MYPGFVLTRYGKTRRHRNDWQEVEGLYPQTSRNRRQGHMGTDQSGRRGEGRERPRNCPGFSWEGTGRQGRFPESVWYWIV